MDDDESNEGNTYGSLVSDRLSCLPAVRFLAQDKSNSLSAFPLHESLEATPHMTSASHGCAEVRVEPCLCPTLIGGSFTIEKFCLIIFSSSSSPLLFYMMVTAMASTDK